MQMILIRKLDFVLNMFFYDFVNRKSMFCFLTAVLSKAGDGQAHRRTDKILITPIKPRQLRKIITPRALTR